MGPKPKVSHYRRCHVCGAVTEQNDQVESCMSCGKTIVPFFYFNESLAPPVSDDQQRPKFLSGQVRPLVGLSAYWASPETKG